MTQTEQPAGVEAAKTVAAIDIGSNAIRMEIAQVFPGGQVQQLERLQRAVRLGQDTFRRGRLGGRSIRAAVGILRDYQERIAHYGVAQIRAVATSAVREASNAEMFLDRVSMAVGLDIEVISTAEESRLTVSAVQKELGNALGVKRHDALIADVGGGSTLLTILHRGKIEFSQSLRLGSIRLQEMLAIGYESPERSAEMLRQQIQRMVDQAKGSLPMKRMNAFVAVGGDARFAARHVGKPTKSTHLFKVSAAALKGLIRHCEELTTDGLADEYGLAFAEAETLMPALLVYQGLLKATPCKEMIVSHVTMRDGLLLDLGRTVTGQEDPALAEGVIAAATSIAEKYNVDLKHARGVASLAMRLFDEFQKEHGLGSRHRLLLHVAAILHEVGGFVSTRAHHKHSYYLISNAEIFGLSRNELLTVAHIARYHRRSVPKPTHTDYVSLPRDTRMVISKLAALLRVADALDRGHAQVVSAFQVERRADEVVLIVPGAADLSLERRALAAKSDLFEEVYGLHLRLDQPHPGQGGQAPSWPGGDEGDDADA